MSLSPRATLLALSTLVLLPLGARADILWKGDFETGDLSQWDSQQVVSADRVQVVDSPVREGNYSLRVAVQQGDDPINASGNRNELILYDNPADGTEVFYRWSTFFPSSYPSTGGWQIFSQFHHTGCCGSPPVEFYIRDEVIHLRVGGSDGRVIWKTPLERVVWKDFILQIRWSSDPRVGRVALWYQGEQVVAPTQIATRYPGDGSYFKLGLYRDASIQPTAVIFHDDVMVATELADVLRPVEDEGVDDAPPTTDEPLPGTDDEDDSGTAGGEPPPSESGDSPPLGEDGEGFPQYPGSPGRWTTQTDVTGCSAAPVGSFGMLAGLASLWMWRRRRRH
ncbi:MAG TPA: heparin lyase I family protein [Myxococcaceae bacterium]|nr:heparin lyase I family protein [Myxococcaceae bacterium]